MIDGYIKWLQTTLGDNYQVVSEEKTDYNKNKNVVILSEYSGTNYTSCIMFNYQAMVLTNNVVDTMKELQEYTWQHNDERISTEEFPYVRNLMGQPVNVSNYQEHSEKYIGTITISITLMASISLNDIKRLTIDGELIDPTTATISYQALTDTNRLNGQELNATDINEASLTVQIAQPMSYTNLSVNTRNIMFGQESKNRLFRFEIEFTDGRVYRTGLKLVSKAFSYDKQALTTDSVTLIH